MKKNYDNRYYKQVKMINIALQIKCILYESIPHKSLIGRKLFNTLSNKL